jgi:hypothetical protein
MQETCVSYTVNVKTNMFRNNMNAPSEYIAPHYELMPMLPNEVEDLKTVLN